MKFIVVGLPKTGKTMVCDCLNSLDDFTVYDEIFVSHLGKGNMPDHPLEFMNDIRKRNRRNCFVLWYQKKYNTSIRDITKLATRDDIDEYLDYIFSKNKHIGFKLHHHHIEVFPYILEYIKNKKIKIIHTDREDKIKQAVAILGNRYRITHTKKKIELETEAVQRCIDDINWRTEQLFKWFNCLKLTYENMTNDKHINELDVSIIKEYLGIDMPTIIKVRTVKNTFSNIEDNVTNYKELNELSKN